MMSDLDTIVRPIYQFSPLKISSKEPISEL